MPLDLHRIADDLAALIAATGDDRFRPAAEAVAELQSAPAVRDVRDVHELTRDIAARVAGDGIRAKARRIVAIADAYAAGPWLRHRDLIAPPAEIAGTPEESVFHILAAGHRFPSFESVRQILAKRYGFAGG